MADIRRFAWSPNWYIVWAERDDRTGKWRSRRLSTGTGVKGQGQTALARFEAQRKRPPDEPNVGAILDAYLSDLSERRWFRNREYELRAVRSHFGDLPPGLINRALVRGFIRRRRAQGAADSTCDRQLRALRAALSWAVKHRWIDAAPYIETPGGAPPRDRWLTRGEFERLCCAAVDPHVRLFIELAVFTGARTRTLLDLTWDRVDMEKRLVMYPPARPRSRKRTTIVPINDTLLAALSQASGVAVSDWVIEYRGRSVQSIKTGYRAAVRRAGIAHCTPHDLRRTCATWMVQDGIQLEKVARYLGATKDMIERVYGHHAPDYLRDAARALEGVNHATSEI